MSTTSPSSSSANKAQRVLACVLCQHRKIKCDRNTPCANCVKANVECIASTPAPARKRRRPNQDLQERLARCEELLKQYATSTPGGSSAPKAAAAKAASAAATAATASGPASLSSKSVPPNFPAREPPGIEGMSLRPPPYEDPYIKFSPVGKMVVEDGSVHFTDSFLWANVYDELQAMKKIVVEEETEDMSTEANTPDDHVDLLLSEVAGLNLEDVFPEPVQTFRLWQVFLERVNPVTKVVHVPSLQPHVVEAASNLTNVPHSVKALLFSIFTLAALSLENSECLQILRCSRNEAIKNFSDGARAALKNTQFLRVYDMPTLQALLLYMLSLQGRYSRHGAWVLNGLLIRIAQKMGLHRDGESLGLTPFDTEMRRRVWWQIIMMDAKWAMLSGLSHSLLPWSWDTKVPSNINDADLFPGSTERVHAREGPTEMAFCLFSFEICKFIIHSQGFPGFESIILSNELDMGGEATAARAKAIAKYKAMVEDFNTRLEFVEQNYTDSSGGPLHEVCAHMRQNIIGKLRGMLVPMQDQPEWGTEIQTPQDNMFKLMLVHNEYGLRSYEVTKDRGFLWYTKLHFQVDVFALMVGMLQRRAAGSLADRAWVQIGSVYAYHDELLDMSQKQNVLIATCVLRAWRERERALTAQGATPSPPPCVPMLRDALPGRGSTPPSSVGEDPPKRPARGGGAAALARNKEVEMFMGGPPGLSTAMDPTMDQFFSGYVDVSALEWDLLGDAVPGDGQGQEGEGDAAAAFTWAGIGPSGIW